MTSEPSVPPAITPRRDGYDLRWNDILMEVRRLRRKDDDWRCELLIGQQIGDEIELIWTGHHNLMAARTRSMLAKDLQEHRDYLPWARMLQELSFLLVQAERAGTPPINLGVMPEPEGLNYIIRGWVLEGKPTALFGLGGSGKTWMGYLAAHAVATGTHFIGYQSSGPAPVSILDYENDAEITRLRFGKIARGLGVEVPQIHYRQLSMALTDYEEVITRDIEEHGIRFAVLDSFALASGGSQQKDDLIIPVYATLRRLGIATLLIDHEAKASNGEYAIGTIYKHNLSRITWHVKATKEDTDTGDLYLLVSNRKANESRRERAFGLQMIFGPTAMVAKRMDAADLPSDLAEDLPLAQRIMRNLAANGRMSTGEIKDSLGESGAQVNTRLKELEKQGKIVQFQAGGGSGKEAVWELPSPRGEFE